MEAYVLLFNRVASLLSAFARRGFAVPCQHFFDDYRVIEPDITQGSGLEYLKWLRSA